MTEPAVRARDLTLRYRGGAGSRAVQAITGLSLDIMPEGTPFHESRRWRATQDIALARPVERPAFHIGAARKTAQIFNIGMVARDAIHDGC